MGADIYEGWKYLNWTTPISLFLSPRLEILMDTDCLTIVVQECAGETRTRVKFVFSGDYAYRNINESFRNNLWSKLPANLGQSLIIENSDFMKLLQSDDVGEETFSGAKHFLIKTEDDVIEVVCTVEPEIKVLENAAPDSILPGKSKIHYKSTK